MYDEFPAPPAPNDPTDEPSADPDPASSRSDREPSRSERDSDRAGPGQVESDRSGDGVDPPEIDETERAESDESCDPKSVEYRIERLRLLRIVVTLAVVVARLIRSL